MRWGCNAKPHILERMNDMSYEEAKAYYEELQDAQKEIGAAWSALGIDDDGDRLADRIKELVEAFRERGEVIDRLTQERDAAVSEIGRIGRELGQTQHERDEARQDAEKLAKENEMFQQTWNPGWMLTHARDEIAAIKRERDELLDRQRFG